MGVQVYREMGIRMDAFMIQDYELHRKMFSSRLHTQFEAMREILLAGDTNRLVAELTFEARTVSFTLLKTSVEVESKRSSMVVSSITRCFLGSTLVFGRI